MTNPLTPEDLSNARLDITDKAKALSEVYAEVFELNEWSWAGRDWIPTANEIENTIDALAVHLRCADEEMGDRATVATGRIEIQVRKTDGGFLTTTARLLADTATISVRHEED